MSVVNDGGFDDAGQESIFRVACSTTSVGHRTRRTQGGRRADMSWPSARACMTSNTPASASSFRRRHKCHGQHLALPPISYLSILSLRLALSCWNIPWWVTLASFPLASGVMVLSGWEGSAPRAGFSPEMRAVLREPPHVGCMPQVTDWRIGWFPELSKWLQEGLLDKRTGKCEACTRGCTVRALPS